MAGGLGYDCPTISTRQDAGVGAVVSNRAVERSSERQHIIDAAYRCLDRNSGLSASISEILEETGLGTRAFYRNFSTKHELFLEMFRRDREAVLVELRGAAARADTPVDELRAWMAHLFEIVSDPRRRKRVATFYSEEMRRTPGYFRELELFVKAEESALAAILHRGKAEGVFLACSPELDARSIRAALEAAVVNRFQRQGASDASVEFDLLVGFVLRGIGAVGAVIGPAVVSGQNSARHVDHD